MKGTLIAAGLLALSANCPGAEVTFTAKPVATRQGDKVKITFTVSAPTDVAVYIENNKGEIVRHLVAGVLGDNPPAPLKPGPSQEFEWDGRADYGKPLDPRPSTPVLVRVARGWVPRSTGCSPGTPSASRATL